MKAHISATIDKVVVAELKRVSRQERRSVSNLIEVALIDYLKRSTALDSIPTSEGVYQGAFNRAEIYED